jgi:hypothetical protein
MFCRLISLDQSLLLLVENFKNGNVRKIKGVSASETSKFKCSIAEKAKVGTRKFREIFTLHLWPYSKDYKFIP